jgi:hypothetical protein
MVLRSLNSSSFREYIFSKASRIDGPDEKREN